MTAGSLQSELAEELRKILKEFRLKDLEGNFSRINIFEQYLPIPGPKKQDNIPPELLENGLAEEETDPEPFPYIIVRISEGEIEDADSAQMVSLILIIGVCDTDYERQGCKDILNIIAKIYERFAKMPVLNGKYTIQYPIEWALQEEESYPVYFGGMALTFETAAIRREGPYS